MRNHDGSIRVSCPVVKTGRPPTHFHGLLKKQRLHLVNSGTAESTCLKSCDHEPHKLVIILKHRLESSLFAKVEGLVNTF